MVLFSKREGTALASRRHTVSEPLLQHGVATELIPPDRFWHVPKEDVIVEKQVSGRFAASQCFDQLILLCNPGSPSAARVSEVRNLNDELPLAHPAPADSMKYSKACPAVAEDRIEVLSCLHERIQKFCDDVTGLGRNRATTARQVGDLVPEGQGACTVGASASEIDPGREEPVPPRSNPLTASAFASPDASFPSLSDVAAGRVTHHMVPGYTYMPAGQPTSFVQRWISDPETVTSDPDLVEAVKQSTNGQGLNEAALLKRLLQLAETRAGMPHGH